MRVEFTCDSILLDGFLPVSGTASKAVVRVVAGLPTEPHSATEGLPKFEETCGPAGGGVRRPAPNRAR